MLVKEKEVTGKEIVDIITKTLKKRLGKVNDDMIADTWMIYAEAVKNGYKPKHESVNDFIEVIVKTHYSGLANENAVRNYANGVKNALNFLIMNNHRISKRIFFRCLPDTSINKKTWDDLIKTSMEKAAKTYNPQKGANFRTYYSAILRNAFIDYRRKINMVRKISKWSEFEKESKKYKNIFDRHIIFKCFYEYFDDYNYDDGYYNDDNDYDEEYYKALERKRKKAFLSMFSKGELDYMALYLRIPVTNAIAKKAMGVSERTIYNIRSRLNNNEFMYRICMTKKMEAMLDRLFDEAQKPDINSIKKYIEGDDENKGKYVLKDGFGIIELWFCRFLRIS